MCGRRAGLVAVLLTFVAVLTLFGDGVIEVSGAYRGEPRSRPPGAGAGVDARVHSTRACGDVRSADAPKHLAARGVTCRAAKRVAVAHWLQSGRFDACAPRHRRCTVERYVCRRAERRITCSRGAKLVRFRYDR